MRVEAVVRRKTQDLVQDAAEDLIRRVVPSVTRVRRAELWAFEVEGTDDASVRTVLEDTTLVVNPNIHRYSLQAWEDAPDSGTRLFVRVHDRVDPQGEHVLRAVRERLGHRDVLSAVRSVVWAVDLDTRDAEEAHAAGETMTGGERGAGILANPHAQDAEVKVVTA